MRVQVRDWFLEEFTGSRMLVSSAVPYFITLKLNLSSNLATHGHTALVTMVSQVSSACRLALYFYADYCFTTTIWLSHVSHRLSEEERQRILLTCNEPEFAALPPGQIVPILADRGVFICSERSFYRVLHSHAQANRCGRARPPQEPRPVPRLRAAGPNQVWSWDITYLPTTVRGVWLYL